MSLLLNDVIGVIFLSAIKEYLIINNNIILHQIDWFLGFSVWKFPDVFSTFMENIKNCISNPYVFKYSNLGIKVGKNAIMINFFFENLIGTQYWNIIFRYRIICNYWCQIHMVTINEVWKFKPRHYPECAALLLS